jgi:DNA repair exonuclease SbcCD ATPase subunit
MESTSAAPHDPASPTAASPADPVVLRQLWLQLQAREQALVERADILSKREQAQQFLYAQRQEELAALETRIRNERRKLAALKHEAARAEAAIVSPGGPAPAATVPQPPMASSTPTLHPGSNLEQNLQIILLDTADQQRIVSEHVRQLDRVKRGWLADWHASLQALAQRELRALEQEADLQRRIEGLKVEERRLQERGEQIIRREQVLQCSEARLVARQVELRSEHGRLIAIIRSRAAANRARVRFLVRLQARWERERREELAQLEERRQLCEVERDKLHRQNEALRLKLQALALRESKLGQWEYVLTQVQAHLLAEDAKPIEAEAELERRLAELERVVERPLRGLAKKETQLASQQDELEVLRRALMGEQRELLVESRQVNAVRRSLLLERAELESTRQRGQQRLQAYRLQQTHFRERIRDLEEQLERLTMSLLRPDAATPATTRAA